MLGNNARVTAHLAARAGAALRHDGAQPCPRFPLALDKLLLSG